VCGRCVEEDGESAEKKSGCVHCSERCGSRLGIGAELVVLIVALMIFEQLLLLLLYVFGMLMPFGGCCTRDETEFCSRSVQVNLKTFIVFLNERKPTTGALEAALGIVSGAKHSLAFEMCAAQPSRCPEVGYVIHCEDIASKLCLPQKYVAGCVGVSR
jgi:hypothetical protein